METSEGVLSATTLFGVVLFSICSTCLAASTPQKASALPSLAPTKKSTPAHATTPVAASPLAVPTPAPGGVQRTFLTEYDAKIIRGTHALSILKLKSENLPVIHKEASLDFSAIIEWSLSQPEWHLIWQENGRNTQSPSHGRREIHLTGPTTVVDVALVGPRGEVRQERFSISLTEWTEMITAAKAPRRKLVIFTTALGITSISYTQGGTPPTPTLNEIALTPKFTISRLEIFGPRWDGSVNLFLSQPVSSNQAGVSLRYLGFNTRLAYNLKSVTPPWKVSLGGGFYYTTTTATGSTIGYENEIGPQFLPSFRYTLSKGDSIGSYVKYALLLNKFSILSLSSREVAVGADWSHPLRSGKRISFSVDFANLSATDPTGIQITNRAISLSTGYTW